MVRGLRVVNVHVLCVEHERVSDEQVRHVVGEARIHAVVEQRLVNGRVLDERYVVVGRVLVADVAVVRVVAGLVDPEAVLVQGEFAALLAGPVVAGGAYYVPSAVHVAQVALPDGRRGAQGEKNGRQGC